MRDDHFISSDIREVTPVKKDRNNKKSGAGLKILGALAVFMALVIAISFGGAALVKGMESAASTQSDGSAAAADVALTSLDISDQSEVKLNDVSDVVEAVMPAVVSITSRSLVQEHHGPYMHSSGTEEVESGIGSGTIVRANSSELLILTSYHVVENSSSLYVTFCDDTAVDGYIKDSSPDDDIAVVAVSLADIPEETLNAIAVAEISSDEGRIGEGVIVIGDALGYGQSVVTGIISALDREITVEDRTITVIQTDAAINSGNSGGCTLNSSGQIIGISEAKISNDSVEGMCYAISISAYYDLIMEMLDEDPAMA